MNSMKAAIIANIGTSDIGKDGTPIFKKGNDVLKISTEIAKDGDHIKNLEAILIEPVIEEIKKTTEIGKIILFATLQEPSNQQDTYYIAKIVKKILISKFGFDEDQIIIEQLQKNPSSYDEMYSVYQNFFSNAVFDSFDMVYISITGGTPAQSFGVLMQAIQKIGTKAIAVYKPNKTKSKPEFLNIGLDISKSFAFKRFEELKERKLFGLAAETARKYGLLSNTEVEYYDALEHNNSFDFDSSIEILERIEKYLPKGMREDAINRINCIKLLENDTVEEFSTKYFQRHLMQTEELVNNMEIKWHNGEYVDFLGRLFRFHESALRIIFEVFYKISTDKKNGRFTEFENKLNSIMNTKEFIDSMDKKNINKMKTYEPTIMNLSAVLRFLCYTKKDEKLKELKEILDAIQKLSELRNYSIIAHGYRGVSKKAIENNYKSNGKKAKFDITGGCVRAKDILKTMVDDYAGNNSISS